MSTGFFVRIGLDSSPNSTGIFTVQQLFIVVTPAAFLAFNYILYGRFIVQCVSPQHSFIRPKWVARVFVLSDITTFLVQVRSCRRSMLFVFSLRIFRRAAVAELHPLQIRRVPKLASGSFSLASYYRLSPTHCSSLWSDMLTTKSSKMIELPD
jgi:hypothetical protein